jgi:hypothetical protein
MSAPLTAMFRATGEANRVSKYDPNSPIRVWYSQATGTAPVRRGPELRFSSFRTLETAREAARSLPPGFEFVRITDGPDAQLIDYPLSRELQAQRRSGQ